jgi:3-deoxy-manno-octulosonate cytidylyltransferase (CMP-KDO synthetase)
MSTAILIPARYNSSRFPGKMLEHFDGVPLVRRVYDICKQTGLDVRVLTDNSEIFNLFDDAIMTPSECVNGTHRCAHVSTSLDYKWFINVQGDMIDITTDLILELASAKEMCYNSIITAHTAMTSKELRDPSVVKMIQTNGRAHWFCRAPLEYGSKHLGIYAYPRQLLQMYPVLSTHPEESLESLEQLRWLQNNILIYSKYVEYTGLEINTPEDAIAWKSKN